MSSSSEYQVILYRPGDEALFGNYKEEITILFEGYCQEVLGLHPTRTPFRWDNMSGFSAIAFTREFKSNKVVGFTTMARHDDEMELTAAFVQRDKRGQGINSMMLDILVPEAELQGATELTIFMPSTRNEQFIPALERKGFQLREGNRTVLVYSYSAKS